MDADVPGELVFDLKDEDLKSIESAVVKFYDETGNGVFIDFSPYERAVSLLTDGNPVGDSSLVAFNQDQATKTLPSGSVTINRIRAQQLDNGYTRFTMVYTLPEQMHIAIFNPPNGDLIALFTESAEAGESGELVFDLKNEDLKAVGSITFNFYNNNGDQSFVFFNTAQLKLD